MEPEPKDKEDPKRPNTAVRKILIAMIFIILSAIAIVQFFYVPKQDVKINSLPSTIDSHKDTLIYDSAKADTMTGQPTVDTAKVDSIEKPRPHSDTGNQAKLPGKFATLGYHYYPAMNIHETQEINVFLSASNIQSAIRDTIIKILEDEDPDRDPSDTGKIAFKEHIPLYKFVTVDLVPLDSGIIVRKTPDAPRQAVDTLAGNRWSWTIFAKSAEKAESKLLLIVYSEDPSRIEKRIIRIQIHVETNFIRLFINYLSEHPGDALFKIVVPLATFFGGLLAGKRRKKDKNADNTDGQGDSD